MADLVLDASAMVDLLLGEQFGAAVTTRISGHTLNAPAHFDAEVLSALGRMSRAGDLSPETVERDLEFLVTAPIHMHDLSQLVLDAWQKRHQLRLVDALYVQLAINLNCPLITTDARLKSSPNVEVVQV